MRLIALLATALVAGCASTSSVVLPAASQGHAQVAVLPLEGPLGAQASDLISEAFAQKGVAVIERAKAVQYLAIDTDLSGTSPDAVQSFSKLGNTLGVRFLFIGTVSAERGPLYSFPHVNMTLRLIDVHSGATRWLGHYGNSLWTSAISQQGDLQRGADDITDEFIKSGGAALIVKGS